jgi:hypothetical protein
MLPGGLVALIDLIWYSEHGLRDTVADGDDRNLPE